jgi:hypothetical protein
VLVVAPQGKTTVSFRSPVSLARGFFCVPAAFGRVAPPPIQSPQRCNVLFRFAVKVHPLIALNAAVKPLTPSIDFDPRVIAYVLFFRVILGHSGELFASASLGKGTQAIGGRLPVIST